MKQYPCPSCGAPVKFASAASVFAVCDFCKSMLVRHDVDIELIGKQAILPEDQSPFQIGTQGTFEKTPFALQGCLRISWSDGFWNEWFAMCVDGRLGWLAEAQGFLSFYFQRADLLDRVKDKQFRLGDTLDIDRQRYVVTDIKPVTVAGSRGELPFQAPAGRAGMSIDLDGPEGHTATVEQSEKETRFYVGRYAEFPTLRFSNLRQIDGW